jgi:KamA family protein
MQAVAHVFPFRINQYVLENLIDWDNLPADPLFRLTFPHPDMLTPEQLEKVMWHLQQPSLPAELQKVIDGIRSHLNPHPDGQREYNIPHRWGQPVPGIQHKYPETVLIFPTAGQTCHAYCTFCFRWAQFVSPPDQKFATREAGPWLAYLQEHPEVTDVLLTGGDPLVMPTRHLAQYIEPLLGEGFEHIQTIRLGTKSIAYWPYRYVTDPDADDLLHLFERVAQAGKHLTLMAHFDHWQELEPPIVATAIHRIRSTGAQIRTQAPLMRHINDCPKIWQRLWQTQVRLGCIPYYFFMARDTGAEHYFQVPIGQAWEIFQTASQKVSGLARTARGPIMSTLPGKVVVDSVTEIQGERVFVLSFLQARDPNWCKRAFFAHYDPTATWLTDLIPAFGESQFFYVDRLNALLGQGAAP